MSDGDQAVLKLVPFPDMVMDIAGRGYFDPAFCGQVQQFFVAFGIAEDQVLLQFQVIVIAAEPVQVLPDQISGFREMPPATSWASSPCGQPDRQIKPAACSGRSSGGNSGSLRSPE